MFYLDRDGTLARMRHDELLGRAERARLAAMRRRAPLPRRAAGPIGRLFVRLGAFLVRYGRIEPMTFVEHLPNTRHIVLN